jgi:tight adherence protein B
MDPLILFATLSVAITAALFTIAIYRSASGDQLLIQRLQTIKRGPALPGDTPQARNLLIERRRGEWLAAVSRDLEVAGSRLRPTEYLAIRLACGLTFFLVALLAFKFSALGMMFGVPIGFLGYLFPRFYIRLRQKRRLKKLDKQLPEALTMLSGALKAGVGLLQGIENVVDNMSSPISEELGKMLHEAALGSGMEAAMKDLVQRIPSKDLDIVITAILIQREVGGNLAEILDTVSYTIRERERIKGEIQTLTTMQRWEGYVAELIPLLLAGLLFLINPDYMMTLFNESVGRIMVGVAVVWQFIGFLIIRKIVDIDI